MVYKDQRYHGSKLVFRAGGSHAVIRELKWQWCWWQILLSCWLYVGDRFKMLVTESKVCSKRTLPQAFLIQFWITQRVDQFRSNKRVEFVHLYRWTRFWQVQVSSSIFAPSHSFKMLQNISSSLRTRLEGFLRILGIYLLFTWYKVWK